jgi:hypothetical protein
MTEEAAFDQAGGHGMETGSTRDIIRENGLVVSKMPEFTNDLTDPEDYFLEVQQRAHRLVPSLDELRAQAGREINRRVDADLREQREHRGPIARFLGRLGLV